MSSSTQTSTAATPSNLEKKKFTVCVYCGSRPGSSPAYMEAARTLGKVFIENGWGLVYGGGTVGLMGEVAKTIVGLGGSSHGIIPEALVGHERSGQIPPESIYGRTTTVKDMHERKRLMAEEADAFIALPGGFGTMEELFETVTWNQLGIHSRPIIVLNIDGFYDLLLGWVDKAVEGGFISPSLKAIIGEAKTPEQVPEVIKSYIPAEGRLNLKWEST
ncbi:hypothetical protein BJ508DRAFT_55133 [Ascobolus immersus RN42]|uniref:Cytokinin riboside 5'-monophosphate phosphoribohydrolase n=1 Tax=Ascobolus immersus RN42 TaxID=1160509 RepID=A0A3N4IDM6_ASCIM|nr:hypothetical protein BJ508DRAFT_55133 [Ascobolus immersus RN42]